MYPTSLKCNTADTDMILHVFTRQFTSMAGNPLMFVHSVIIAGDKVFVFFHRDIHKLVFPPFMYRFLFRAIFTGLPLKTVPIR